MGFLWMLLMLIASLKAQLVAAQPTPVPTPEPTATVRPVATKAPAPTAAPAPRPAPTASETVLACLRTRESGGRYHIVHDSGMHYGAYGFDLQTWQSVGGVGYPHHASPAEQDYRASVLLQQRGLQPWNYACSS